MPSPRQSPRKFSVKALLDLLRDSGKPVAPKTIFGFFGADAALKKRIKSTLSQQLESGGIVRVGKGYGLMEALPRMSGVLDVRRSGVGYLIPDDRSREDLFIHPRNFGGAWPGDRVEAVLDAGRRREAPEGRIVAVLERAAQTLTVRVGRRIRAGRYFCQPVDSRMSFAALVDTTALDAPEKGDILIVSPEKEQEAGVWLCTALRRLGVERDLTTQELLVKAGHGIPERFPESVLREADGLPPDPLPGEWQGRAELRAVPLVTIDGETARDFDDAVYVEQEENGYRLLVAIADVAHYVREGSELDVEALARGNSCYFPLSVEPMLPEALSNGLCSLRPGVPRLAVVADMRYSRDGEPVQSRFYEAVISSHARLTYTQVQAALDGDAAAVSENLLPMLHDARELAEAFLRRRIGRGCLDFDVPEIRIRQEGGEVLVDTAVRLFSHRLIEEFMIAANERVAEHLEARGRVFPYRVHPRPDERKLESLGRLLAGTSLADRLPPVLDQPGLQALSRAARGTDMEYAVGRLILRTMMLAQYAPENDGHYGLASEAYCHFTSPIRRYADLLVHRALKRMLAGQPEARTPEELQSVCDGLNACERKAMEAEREIQKRAAILALEKRLGETMRAVISGVADFGFWVELTDMPVDGLVRLATLDEYYAFDPERQELLGQRTGRAFRLGLIVDVTLDAVNLERVEINFTLAE